MEEPEPIAAAPEPAVAERRSGSQLNIAAAIRGLRQRTGLSQRQLALRMSVPRTYVSKIENEKATPTLSSLQRLADALEVTVPALLESSCGQSQEQMRELLADDFIAELLPHIRQLDAMQRSTFLTQVRELSTRPRRSA
jgi:transcriptional regulator with XRE-family HTH domain